VELRPIIDPTDDVLRLVRDVLGDGMIGAYAHGSAVFGGLRRYSDLDVLVVEREPTTDDQRRRLIDGLLRVSGRYPPVDRRPVELTLVVQSQVRPWRYPPVCDLQYGEWMRADLEHGGSIDPAGPSPDLAPLLTMVLLGDRPLAGPPPAEVLGPVPPDDLRRSGIEAVPGLLADLDDDTRNVLLTLARIWTTLVTGEVRSKAAAADWALERLPPAHRPVLVHARDAYLGEVDEDWSTLRPAIRPHVDVVLAAIEGLAPASDV
jgi:streptomycin 3"-adenylyltransferase